MDSAEVFNEIWLLFLFLFNNIGNFLDDLYDCLTDNNKIKK